MNRSLAAVPALLLMSLPLAAQTVPAPAIQSVEVKGASDTEQRRNDTAGRITVGREELVRYGDSTLSAVLRRQPGISVVGGDIRMRGLG